MEQLSRSIDGAYQRIAPYFARREFLWETGAFAVGVLLGRVGMLSIMSPLAPAWVAAGVMAGMNPFYAFFGCILGLFITPDVIWSAVASCSAFMALYIIIKGFRGRVSKIEALVSLAAVQLGILLLLKTGSLYSAALGVADMLLSLCLAVVFYRAVHVSRGLGHRRLLGEEELISLCVLAGALVMGLNGIALWQMTPAVFAAAFLTLMMAYYTGVTAAGMAVALGVTMYAAGGVPPVFIGALAVCALVAGVCRRVGRVGVMASFVLCNAVLTLYMGGGNALNMWDAGIAGMLFLALPKKAMAFMSGYMETSGMRERNERSAMRRVRELTAKKLMDIADVFSEMKRLHEEAAPGKQQENGNVRTDFIRAAKGVCQKCRFMGTCWRDEQAACDALLNMLASDGEPGRCGLPAAVAPLHKNCGRVQAHMQVLQSLFTEYSHRVENEKKAARMHGFVCRQLESVSRTIGALSHSMDVNARFDGDMEEEIARRLDIMNLRAREVSVLRTRGHIHVSLSLSPPHGIPACRSEFPCGGDCAGQLIQAVSRAARQKMRVAKRTCSKAECRVELEEARVLDARWGRAVEGCEGVSGDSALTSELENGRILFAMSDGMGTGVEARRESGAALKLLADMYSAGFDRDVTHSTLNELLMARGEEIYATVDACVVDLVGGRAEFIKFGAPPSFLLRGGKASAIRGEALPMGIVEEAQPVISRVGLKSGDTIALMTDGVYDALGDDVSDMVVRCVGSANTCRDAACALVAAARERGANDDMGVTVVRICA